MEAFEAAINHAVIYELPEYSYHSRLVKNLNLMLQTALTRMMNDMTRMVIQIKEANENTETFL